MNVLLIGSGAREHALAWAISASPLLSKLVCAPGNPGMAELSRCVALDVADHKAVLRLCRKEKIDLAVVGPEAPLVAGLVDDLAAAGFKAFGPSKAAAQLEGSKGFAKDLCRDAGIPTAAYRRVHDPDSALAYAGSQNFPLVVKAGGLAAGKGVTIAKTMAEAEAAIRSCFAGAFGGAGAEIVIEAFIGGEEVSFFALVDGTNCLPLVPVRDYKRAFDGDEGPNTGGMGAYSPVSVVTAKMNRRIVDEIVKPAIAEMSRREMPFRGVLFAGVMVTVDGPKLIEFNVRFGDPECQVLMMRLKSDLLTALLATVDGTLCSFDLQWRNDAAVAVVMAAEGYPGEPQTGTEIRGLDAAAAIDSVEVFQAATRREGDRLLAAGGRVLTVAARGRTVSEAKARAYKAVGRIDWPEGFSRLDIGGHGALGSVRA